MFGTRIYELYARWEAAQETGSFFDLDANASSEEASDVRLLIDELYRKQWAADPDEPTAPQVGDTFGGFRLLGVLGAGGFGTVFRAEDLRLKRKVALKVLHNRARSRPDAKESFLAEARALAAVQHEHVIPILQVGEEDGRPFLVMPLLGGETLGMRIERDGALPPAEVARIGREAAAGLAAIHAKGLVHRDLKPGNIWLETGSGRVKVLDLGLAHDPLGLHVSSAGTPSYMSPEQADGQDLDFRSDLFSLGTVLYECASGRRPFQRESAAETLRAVREETPLPLVRVNPGVPSELATLIDRLHLKDPARRPSSAHEVESSLKAIVLETPVSRSRNRGRLIAVVAAAVLLPVLAYAAWTASRPRDQIESRHPPAAVEPEPLRIQSLHVSHYGRDERPRGVIGLQGSFGATAGDLFVVKGALSRPAYCYLLVFHPDGKETLLDPPDKSEVPTKTNSPFYPSRQRSDRFEMTEGTGLWLVALVASEEPLPCYRDWRAANPAIPWRRHDGKPGFVWLDDGQIVETLDNGKLLTRGDRASKESPDKAAVVSVVDWLREQSKGTVSAVAFTVQDK